MNALLAALDRHARERGDAPAVCSATQTLSYAQLQREVEALAAVLQARCIGVLLDNGPAWVVADLAALRAGITCVPLPGFFSDAQLRHVLADAGVDVIVTDQPARLQRLFEATEVRALGIAGTGITLLHLQTAAVAGLQGIAKVTYTSGTTGTPKGVCLEAETLLRVTESLRAVTCTTTADRSLALLPLATLLENIASVYVMLLAGACCVLAPLAELGMLGAARLQPQMLLQALQQFRPTGIVLIPQLLQALVEIGEAGAALPDTLRFIAVGGAPVAPQLLERAQRLGLPVYEGYGLSEAASVVSVNTPQACRSGSVGQPLPHVRVRIAADGEIEVAGALCAGYLGATDTKSAAFWPTGDIGHVDADGYLYLSGRKKHIFITAFGRNVAPEWVERELLLEAAIAQAVVYGEARPFNVAIVVPRPGAGVEALQRAIDNANRRLPDYARISRFLLSGTPFTVDNGLLTGTARPRRGEIIGHYADAIRSLYNEVA